MSRQKSKKKQLKKGILSLLLKIVGKIVLSIFILGGIYLLTLFFPEPFFTHKLIVDSVTVYSDEKIPETEITSIVKTAIKRVQKSKIYKKDIKERLFIANNPLRWAYFSNINYKASGLNYVCFNHTIFFRKTDIKNNRLYGYSGKVAKGDRTFDYFIAHEITHTLEFNSMPWYKYPLTTNWVLEGYSDYIGHDSKSYEEYLNHYLYNPENVGAKYYSRARTMVAYILQKKQIPINQLWMMTNKYDNILKEAIPNDKPSILN